MFLNLTDINGVKPEVGDIIAYFRPKGDSYWIKAGYVEEITPHEIVAKGWYPGHGMKTDRIRTGMYVVPKFEPNENLEEVGVDAFGTPVCFGDTIVSASLFNIFDEMGYSDRKKTLMVGRVLEPHVGDWVRIDMQRVITVRQGSNAYKYNIPNGNRLERIEYSEDQIYDDNFLTRRTSEIPVRHPGDYRIGIKQVRAKLTNSMVLKKSNRIATYLLQNRLSV